MKLFRLTSEEIKYRERAHTKYVVALTIADALSAVVGFPCGAGVAAIEEISDEVIVVES